MQTMRRPTIGTQRKACTAALAPVLALALLLTTGGVAAAQESGEWIDTKILDKVLKGVGLRRGEQVIDYRERSPLVIPPSSALPPPQSEAATARNPAWPKDPDVERAREAQKSANAPRTPWYEENRPLTRAELDKGRTRTRQRTVSSSSEPDNGRRELLWPSQLGYKGGLFSGSLFGKEKDEVVQFKGEPPRTSLTEPPTGYRTPSSAQTYGVVTQEKSKPENSYSTHHESR